MKIRSVVAYAGILGLLLPQLSSGQQGTQQDPGSSPREVSFSNKSPSGPRVGFTVVPGNSELAQKMNEAGLNSVISQFGWHFEHAVVAGTNGPAFLVEFIPLVGAVESGKPIGSLSLMMGIRLPSGYEFGVGPNVILTQSVKSGVVLALGRTFNVQGVGIPVNVAYATSPIGGRVSVIVGYAI